MTTVHDGAVLESCWNGFESRRVGGLGVFSLRCTTATPVDGPALYVAAVREGDSAASSPVEDIVDEALFYFKTLVLLPRLSVDKAGDRVLLVLVSFLHECLRRIQTCHRVEAAQTLSQLRYSYAREAAHPTQRGLLCFTCVSKTAEERRETEAYLVQLFTEASSRLVEKVFQFPSPDGLGSKWWLLFGRRNFLN